MSFYHKKTWLQTLFWEIKSRFFYILFAFGSCFFVSYLFSPSLLYLFVLSYDIKEKTSFSIETLSTRVEELKAKILTIYTEIEEFIRKININALQALEYPKTSNFISEFISYFKNKDFFSLIAKGETLKGEKENISFLTIDENCYSNNEKALEKKIFLKEQTIENPCVSVETKTISFHDAFEEMNIKEVRRVLIDFFKEKDCNAQNTDFFTFFSKSLLKTSEQDLNILYQSLNSIDLNSITFIFTDVEEAFKSSILVCLVFSLIAVVPHILYNFVSFSAPSLFLHENKKVSRQVMNFLVFWFIFIFYLESQILPKLAEFLLNFQISSTAFNINAETKIYSYCNWASTIFIISNIIFFLLFFTVYSIINRKIEITYFVSRRKACRIQLLLISALLAPPDIFTQLFFTFNLILSFELLVYLFFLYKNLRI